MKVYSVVVAAAWLQVLKLGGNAERSGIRTVAAALLAVNILEAVIAGACRGGYLAAVAGLLLIATQAAPEAIRVERSGRAIDVHYQLGAGWIAAYTCWNLAFIWVTAPAFVAFAIAHLVGPLVAARGRAERWIQARVVGLALLMTVRMTAPHAPWIAAVPTWRSPVAADVLAALAVVMAGWGAVRTFRADAVERSRSTLLALALRSVRARRFASTEVQT